MISGLNASDDDPASPGTEERLGAQADWYKHILDLPVIHKPGTQAVCSSPAFNLVGEIIQNATRTWLPDFF